MSIEQQIQNGEHRRWLEQQANYLIEFFAQQCIDPEGGFHALDRKGAPLVSVSERYLHETTRMIHCFSIAKLLGYNQADQFIDHGISFLNEKHRDPDHDGYFWCVSKDNVVDSTKQAYGHAFVLLAAASARMAGHGSADELFNHISDIISSRFWDEKIGCSKEEFETDWAEVGPYRGQNSNMHLTEALMAAFEASSDRRFLDMADRIADMIINRHAKHQGWRVVEHFDETWQINREYSGNPMFRPYGITPGHALEWSRLLINLWELGNRQADWMPGAAKNLFQKALETGWDQKSGGISYTLDWKDQVHQGNHFWWPCAEAIGAAATLAAIDEDQDIRDWYIRIWEFVNKSFIDHEYGGWHPEVNGVGQPVNTIFASKPDIYHALQACLLPLVPVSGGIMSGLATRSSHSRTPIDCLKLP